MNWISLFGLEAFVARWHAAGLEGVLAAQDRVELAQLEWQEYKRHLRQLLVLGVSVFALTMPVLVVLSMAVMAQFWETPQRLLVVWVVAGVWLLAWAGALLALLAVVRKTHSAFGLTSRELKQDWQDIKEQL